MRTLAAVEADLDRAWMEQEHWKDREEALLDERVRVEDHEAAQRECKRCEGTGWIDTYELEEDSPERIDAEGTCPVCGGSGEVS